MTILYSWVNRTEEKAFHIFFLIFGGDKGIFMARTV